MNARRESSKIFDDGVVPDGTIQIDLNVAVQAHIGSQNGPSTDNRSGTYLI
jgi:hypothetical protein